MLIGHQKNWEYWQEALAQNRLAPAFLLSGVSGVGKKTFAEEAASALLGVPTKTLASQPDYYALARSIDKETGKIKRDISVDDVRELKQRLSNRAWGGRYQVAVIENAERLSLAAGNALLKLLEEPVGPTAVFLLVEHEGSVLPTIRSRAERLYFAPVSAEVITQALLARGWPAAAVAAAVAAAWGRPGRALKILTDQPFSAAVQAAEKRWQSIAGSSLATKFAVVEELCKATEETPDQRGIILAHLEHWLLAARLALLAATRSGAGKEIIQRALSSASRLLGARAELDQNINLRLLLEQAVWLC